MQSVTVSSGAGVVPKSSGVQESTRRNSFRLRAASKPHAKATLQLHAARKHGFSRKGCVSVQASSVAPSSRPGESPEETAARRIKESTLIENRSIEVHTREELEAFLTEAEDKLVLVSIESDDECDLGDNPDAWAVRTNVKDMGHTSMEACVQLKSSIMRVARETEDAVFLTIPVNDKEGAELAQGLGVTRFPTFQYYKSGQLLWQHVGAGSDAGKSVGEGVLYYAGQGAEGVKAEDYITEIGSQEDFDDFLEMCAAPQSSALGLDIDVECTKQLAVMDVSLQSDSPACMHIYPAVLALARNMAGAARWSRLLGDSSDNARNLMNKMNITQVPTFVFFCEGKEVGRYVGNDRLKLVDQVLKFQAENGVKLPQRAPRKRMTTAEAKAIAKAKREAAKSRQNLFG